MATFTARSLGARRCARHLTEPARRPLTETPSSPTLWGPDSQVGTNVAASVTVRELVFVSWWRIRVRAPGERRHRSPQRRGARSLPVLQPACSTPGGWQRGLEPPWRPRLCLAIGACPVITLFGGKWPSELAWLQGRSQTGHWGLRVGRHPARPGNPGQRSPPGRFSMGVACW